MHSYSMDPYLQIKPKFKEFNALHIKDIKVGTK